jgi:hypothetical protein
VTAPASKFYVTDPEDPEAPVVLAEYNGKHHGVTRPGDTVEYDDPGAPWLGSPAPDGVPLIVTEIIDFGGGFPPQAILNDGAWEVSADNLRRK